MARREFPALGFDPAPGDPAALTAAAGGVGAAGRLFADAAGTVARLGTSGWTGEAGDAFRSQLADLPRDLDLAARSHTAAARALTDYAAGLPRRQRLADDLETRAAELRRQQQAAVAEVNRLAARTAPAGSDALDRLRGQYGSARSRVEGLGTDLAAVLRDARLLAEEHRGTAGSAARAIRAVADAPYEEPGWLSRAWDSVTSWISDHADVLRQISGVLKGISAVLGVLSFVPGLQFLAPFAIAAGGLALLIDGALCLAGEGDWSTFALDAALTILPTGPVVRAFRRIPGVARGLDLAGDTLAAARGRVGDVLRVSGGTARPRVGLEAEWDWADDAYDSIRAADDVGAVTRNVADAPRLDGGSGFPADEVHQVKRHVFVDEHRIHDYQGGFEVRRFDANPDMADAWLRLRGGRHLPEDVALLEHELAELRYWRQHPQALYDEAHAAANRVSDWESRIPAPTYENYAEGW